MTRSASLSPPLVCVGGAVINRKYHSKAPIVPATSNPCAVHTSLGGVARNVAETLARLGHPVALLSVLGDDAAGRSIAQAMRAVGVDMSLSLVTGGARTAEYAAILDADHDLHVGLAAMDIFDRLTPDRLNPGRLTVSQDLLNGAPWVFAECNCPPETLAALIAGKRGGKLAIDTVSVPKAMRLPADLAGIDLVFTNKDEAAALTGQSDASPDALCQAILARGAKAAIVTLGGQGHVVAEGNALALMPASAATVVDVTGAGDALTAGTLHGLVAGLPLQAASQMGARLAGLTVASPLDVLPDLDPTLLQSKPLDPFSAP